ncbi:MAG: YlxR family protein, partial [Dehalococcoidia bacterium]
MIRVCRTPDGSLRVDPAGKGNGRGAYLCGTASCWERGA